MPPLGRQVGGSPQDDDAKNMFDRIGKIVHDQVKSESNGFKDELKGNLTSSIFFGGERANSLNPCTLVEEYRKKTLGTVDNNNPCRKDGTGKEEVNRFSVKEQAEYDNKKIKCSNGRDFGACAPYRRLSLCNKNLVKMDTNNNDGKAKHDLLAEVCYAAKYEGESITQNHGKYQLSYPGSQICTMLARSFADIGDIVRGRDLYLGDNRKDREQKQKLQENLNKIFNDIKKNNQSKLGRLSLDQIREY
ncbi:hypothetical protein PFTANZ_01797, partial [Plasmodium falciparum Tanzania (2000708)]